MPFASGTRRAKPDSMHFFLERPRRAGLDLFKNAELRARRVPGKEIPVATVEGDKYGGLWRKRI